MAESHNIEYKESWRDEYLKWVCGFANAQGGTIYIGIDDAGNVVGVNPDIANVFYRAGYIETWGQGIQKICDECT
ncbi:MAG: putative DNA binding domain-containing protein, partial [Lachnospiraceae bacterium]|nr:putative DNA binding domain-containing protein [Lachnospiraceae bacterium]